MRKLVMLTTGQSPRQDWAADLEAVLPPGTQLVQAGVLDGMTIREVEALDFAPGDNVIVTKMQDSNEVRIPEHHARALVIKKLTELENAGFDIIYLACTWDFKLNPGKALIICPQKILAGILPALALDKTLGLCVPDERQIKAASERWGPYAGRLVLSSCNPYQLDDDARAAAEKFNSEKVDLVLLDCMGFTKEAGDFFRKITGKPVLVPRILVNRILAELL